MLASWPEQGNFMLSLMGLVGGLGLLIYLTIRGMNLFLAAPLCAVIVGLTNGMSLFVGDGNFDMRSSANPTGVDKLVARMNNNEFDLVAVGRALLVDPEWLQKVQTNALEEIKPYTKEALMTLS